MTTRSFISKFLTQYLAVLSMLILMLMTSTNCIAQEVKVKTSANKKSIIIGDPIQFRHEIELNEQKFRVQLPRLADTFNKFEVIKRFKTDTSRATDRTQLILESTLTNFDEGQWIIPSQTFVVTPLDGSPTYEILSPEVPITVKTIDADTSKPIKPIYEIIEAKQSWWDAIKYYLFAILGLLLLIVVLYFIYKKIKKREKKPKISKKKYIAPWETATRSLQKVIQQEGWMKGEEKQHHTELSDIIRTYIEDAFDIDCFEKTSQEIITSVKKFLQKRKYKKRSETLDKLRTIFTTADLVKFAKSKPTEEEHQQSNEAALSFVTTTAEFLKQEKTLQETTD